MLLFLAALILGMGLLTVREPPALVWPARVVAVLLLGFVLYIGALVLLVTQPGRY